MQTLGAVCRATAASLGVLVVWHRRRAPDGVISSNRTVPVGVGGAGFGARIESMLATSRVKLRHNRLVARRGPRLAAVMTGRPRRLVVIATLPPIGTRIATLGPLTRARRSQPGTRPR
jgi:hypothetical protein